MIYAVIDTNVLVSALLTSNLEAATVKVLEALQYKKITPLYNDEIINEYVKVLRRILKGNSGVLCQSHQRKRH